ncbi:hypothetical protein [Ideonella sp. BN130291]|uniref:hypothetical protein n=1 Tax=Ideonella sp. BN130291 TaxID=3112940 RepID=UPI002E26BB52|nr:hypothetical protein [Ideonella sp. BN130291]
MSSSLLHRLRTPRHIQWLLWLALLLPFAQAAADWHGYSHVRADAGADPDTQQALHPEHCDLCLSAAGLASGPLLGKLPGMPPSAARHAAPRTDRSSTWVAAAPSAYFSRAPPVLLH